MLILLLNIINNKISILGEKPDQPVVNCDVSIAAKSTMFLYTANLDLESIKGLYKYHLVSRRRIPVTICPSWKFIQVSKNSN